MEAAIQIDRITGHGLLIPAEAREELQGVLCAEHTDYGTMTLLFQDELEGLEVKTSNDKWIPVPIISKAILVNTGDLMEIWSAGQIPATIHRVVSSAPEAPKARQSIPYFINPDNETLVGPLVSPPECKKHLKFPTMVAREYCQNRLGYNSFKTS